MRLLEDRWRVKVDNSSLKWLDTARASSLLSLDSALLALAQSWALLLLIARMVVTVVDGESNSRRTRWTEDVRESRSKFSSYTVRRYRRPEWVKNGLEVNLK